MTKNLNFVVPSFITDEQLFGCENILFIRKKKSKENDLFSKDKTIIRIFKDPKSEAEKYCKKINLGGQMGPGIVRLTTKSSKICAWLSKKATKNRWSGQVLKRDCE